MLDRSELDHAIDLQQRSYCLLKWMASAVRDGFIEFKTAHNYSTLPEAALGWIDGHYLNIPADARVERELLPAFTSFFSTYLENSFDLVAEPGKQLYSPDAHCFCPMCSWLIDAPNLKTKRVGPRDKRRADKLRSDALAQLAIERSTPKTDSEIATYLSDHDCRRDAALIAYGHDLLERVNGIANGPAILSLWRGFAWSPSGSPIPKFKLTSDCILDAEQRLIDALLNRG
ncbi:hypothetical protein LF1_52680 [Rubripirellula obstinata]|uniref:Uncharacterized protein n=1 Tax=Rubripirellula obstinata TaxID=406547 RepID=A0A5B1CCJ6_9BACT|nr:hypothetical protein [Rubripirellula obstinata]KAA1257419.1 hypothetical protein LF1_52680 [Rubripirellula obstinata]